MARGANYPRTGHWASFLSIVFPPAWLAASSIGAGEEEGDHHHQYQLQSVQQPDIACKVRNDHFTIIEDLLS